MIRHAVQGQGCLNLGPKYQDPRFFARPHVLRRAPTVRSGKPMDLHPENPLFDAIPFFDVDDGELQESAPVASRTTSDLRARCVARELFSNLPYTNGKGIEVTGPRFKGNYIEDASYDCEIHILCACIAMVSNTLLPSLQLCIWALLGRRGGGTCACACQF